MDHEKVKSSLPKLSSEMKSNGQPTTEVDARHMALSQKQQLQFISPPFTNDFAHNLAALNTGIDIVDSDSITRKQWNKNCKAEPIVGRQEWVTNMSW